MACASLIPISVAMCEIEGIKMSPDMRMTKVVTTISNHVISNVRSALISLPFPLILIFNLHHVFHQHPMVSLTYGFTVILLSSGETGKGVDFSNHKSVLAE